MAIVNNILNPNIITFEFRQAQTDEDYGSCLWARFNLDLINYSMQIESDCGNYAYTWVPTPQTESFLNLCSRFNAGYLLDKLSERSVVDGKRTFENLEEMITDAVTDLTEKPDFDIEEIKDACYSRHTESEAYNAIESAFESAGLGGLIEGYDIWESIVKDYPNNAKKIVDVYMKHIIPAIKESLEEITRDNGVQLTATAYLIPNIEEYGKFLAFLINKDVNVWRLYWDEREKGDRCFNINWKEKRCYYSSRKYYENNGYKIVTPKFICNKYGDYELCTVNSD